MHKAGVLNCCRRETVLVQDYAAPEQADIGPVGASEEGYSASEEGEGIARGEDGGEGDDEIAAAAVCGTFIPGGDPQVSVRNCRWLIVAYRSPVSFLYNEAAAELMSTRTLNATTASPW